MSEDVSQRLVARIAFAGLFPLCEEILRAALRQRKDIELVEPWTELPSINSDSIPGVPELLFVQLNSEELPQALRVLVAAAEPLRIVGLSTDARVATLFSIHERRTVMLDYAPGRLWDAVIRAQ
jgi:hypothetical protein